MADEEEIDRERAEARDQWLNDYRYNRMSKRARLKGISPFELARIAECPFEPQSSDSGDGAAFLKVCRDYALDATREYDLDTEDEVNDAILEVAENCIPHHTYTKWITWVELGGYRDPDPDDLGGTQWPDTSRLPDLALYFWAWRIVTHIFSELGYDA